MANIACNHILLSPGLWVFLRLLIYMQRVQIEVPSFYPHRRL